MKEKSKNEYVRRSQKDSSMSFKLRVVQELEIHQTTETGTIVYSETHSTTTNGFGIVNLEVGSVNPTTFATIDWAAGPYFVEVIVDGTSMGVSELLTVPYALYAVNGVPGPPGRAGNSRCCRSKLCGNR